MYGYVHCLDTMADSTTIKNYIASINALEHHIKDTENWPEICGILKIEKNKKRKEILRELIKEPEILKNIFAAKIDIPENITYGEEIIVKWKDKNTYIYSGNRIEIDEQIYLDSKMRGYINDNVF